MSDFVWGAVTLYVWCLIGDLLLSLQRWREEDETALSVLFWPNRVWWTLMNLIHDWRKELYYRNKHR